MYYVEFSAYFPFPYWIVFPAGALGYIAYSFPVGDTVWLVIIMIIIIIKYATVQAFFANMTLADIRSTDFWRNNHTIAARYLPLNIGQAQPCFALGRPTTRAMARRR